MGSNGAVRGTALVTFSCWCLPRSEEQAVGYGCDWREHCCPALSPRPQTCAVHLGIREHQLRATEIISTPEFLLDGPVVFLSEPHLLLNHQEMYLSSRRVSGSQPHLPFSCLLVSGESSEGSMEAIWPSFLLLPGSPTLS